MFLQKTLRPEAKEDLRPIRRNYGFREQQCAEGRRDNPLWLSFLRMSDWRGGLSLLMR